MDPKQMGRRALWAAIRNHIKTCTCPHCTEWERRWTLVERETREAT
jgi:hypothetical protein